MVAHWSELRLHSKQDLALDLSPGLFSGECVLFSVAGALPPSSLTTCSLTGNSLYTCVCAHVCVRVLGQPSVQGDVPHFTKTVTARVCLSYSHTGLKFILHLPFSVGHRSPKQECCYILKGYFTLKSYIHILVVLQ